jgi:cis-3-alkyl-4-acyloxetan-2-one decarboxylase
VAVGAGSRPTRVAASAQPELTPTQRVMDERDWTFGGTWPYEPRWLFTDGIRLHYVDEGPPDGDPVVLLHGTPWWSYVFRQELAELAAAGKRVVAYDQLGFGRSDKPGRESEYSLARDVSHLDALARELGLDSPALVAQGSARPIARAVAGAGPVEERDELPLPDVVRAPLVGRLLLKGLRLPLRGADLTDEERAAYLAPHPSWASRSGIVASLRRDAP